MTFFLREHLINKNLFIPIFNVLIFLVFLFAESFLGLYIIAGFSIFLILLKNGTEFSYLNSNLQIKIIVCGWMVFLFGMIQTTFFSHSVPHSLNKLAFYIFSFIFFVFFLSIKKKQYGELASLVFKSIVFQAVNLALISIVLIFFPNLGRSLPDMNIIYSTFGHNHLSSLLILVLPISWYFAFVPRKNNVYLFASLLLTLSLLLSFGRATIVIGFVQIVLIFISLKKNARSKYIKKIFLTISLIFLFFLITLSFFSLNQKYTDKSLCPFNLYSNRICKPIYYESRPQYWMAAIISTKDNILFGYGLGTFEFISNKYRKELLESTGFAHNAFLQMFAEAGLFIGLIFFILMILMLFNTVSEYLRLNNDLQNQSEPEMLFIKFVIIAVLSIYLNVMVDFDWSFLGIFLITLFYVSYLLRSLFSVKKLNKNNKVISVLSIVLSYALVFFAIIYLLVDILIILNYPKTALNLFPYFQHHQFVFLNNDGISEEDEKKIEQIYQYDSKFYGSFLHKKYDDIDSSLLSEKEVEQLLNQTDHYCFIDPIGCQFWKKNLIEAVQKKADFYDQLGNIENAEKNLTLMKKLSGVGYWELTQLGNYYVKSQKYDLAEREFLECLRTYADKNNDKKHDDCAISFDAIQNFRDSGVEFYLNKKRYWEVSQIIQGISKWQDFN